VITRAVRRADVQDAVIVPTAADVGEEDTVDFSVWPGRSEQL
jgi:hypothetical protein